MLGCRARRRPAPCCPPAGEGTDDRDASSPTVVLVGNPNVGKSTIFNAVTGAHHHVGNWPGKTVQVASGRWVTDAGPVTLTDLPGTYSLQPRSPDEELVRDTLTAGRPDLVVAVVDAANLARNLYLLGQVLDTGVPIVVALTMLDVAADRGVRVDPRTLSSCLGVAVVPVRPRGGQGLAGLAGQVAMTLAAARDTPARSGAAAPGEPGRDAPAGDEGADEEAAERRYEWVRGVVAASVRRTGRGWVTRSDRVDRVLTSRWLGPPLFLLVMWAVFVATTWLAAPLQDGLSWLVDGPVRDGVGWLLGHAGLGGTWFAALVDGGLVAGVGQLLTFVPLMAIMFVLLTLVEDSGYLARAALVADRLLGVVGLPGRAFLPLIIGFGCNVPAIAGTRVLPNARHRLLTGLLVPFVTCSARLTVYVLLAGVFFGNRAGTVVFAMYLLSIALVVLVGLALRHTVFRGEPREALLLELPPYRCPTVRVVAAQTWQRLAGFLRTAAGIIVVTVMAVWLMTAIPLDADRFGQVDATDSLYGGVSRVVAPVFTPAGFGDWHVSGALVTGFVAKEAVVSTFAQTYQTPEGTTDLGERLRATFVRTSGGHPEAAVLAFMVFLLAYTPCAATVAAQRAEIGGRWTLAGVGLQLAVAWVLATAVFQIGRLLT
ncbi:MAG: ferrous iron transport protein B [Actinophytocola sp.]|nr:ferrous iron transport protein B [Actinophytocola sp.]